MSQQNTQKAGIIVLGPHRSGTSVTTRIFGELGCSYAGELIKAEADNPLGYWEHAEVVSIHNNFLALIHSGWNDTRPIPQSVFSSPEAEIAQRRLLAVFQRDFDPERLWVLKDPRQCRLLPLWNDIIDSWNSKINFVHVFRNPYAVAESLAVRNQMGLSSSLLLWLRHILESERFTRDKKRVWMSLEDIVSDTEHVFKQASANLGLLEVLNFPEDAAVLTNLVNPSMVHHRGYSGRSLELRDLYPWIDRTVEALERLKDNSSEDIHEVLDRIASELRIADAISLHNIEFSPEHKEGLRMPETYSSSKHDESINALTKELWGFLQEASRRLELIESDTRTLRRALSEYRSESMEPVLAEGRGTLGEIRSSPSVVESAEVHDSSGEKRKCQASIQSTLHEIMTMLTNLQSLIPRESDLNVFLSRNKLTENKLLAKSLDLISEMDEKQKKLINEKSEISRRLWELENKYEKLKSAHKEVEGQLAESERTRIEREGVLRQEFERRTQSELAVQKQKFHESRSWKLTSPIRFIGKTFFRTDRPR